MNIWKYKIIEYEVKSMSSDKIEYAKTLHKTNSKIMFYLIILSLKLSKIKYDKIIRK